MQPGQTSPESPVTGAPATTRPAGFAARFALPILGLILLLGLFLRVRVSLHTPLWFEEIYVVLLSRMPLAGVFDTAARDVHPPLHFVLRHFVIAVAGESEAWQRGLSLALWLASALVTFRLSRRLFGVRAALVASGLLAVTYTLVRFSQEVNFFTMQWLLVVTAVDAAMLWIERGRRRDLAVYGAAGLVGLYTHYAFTSILPLVWAWGAWRLGREPARRRPWLLAHVALAALFVPQLPILYRQWLLEGSAAFFKWPSATDFFQLGRIFSLSHNWAVPVFALLALVPLARAKSRPAALLFWALVVLPPFEARLIPLTFPREFIFAGQFFLPLVAAGLDAIPSGAVVSLLTVALLAVGTRWNLKAPFFPEAISMRRAFAMVDSLAAPGDLIVHAETHSAITAEYYDPRHHNRLLYAAGKRVPHFDGGLVIPDSLTISPGQWEAVRASGRRWWAMSVDRIYITKSVPSRASAQIVAQLRDVARGRRWTFPPVTLWEGVPADSAGAAR